MSGCNRCEWLPASLPERGMLYIAPPQAHTQATLRRFLRHSGIAFAEPQPDILAIPYEPGGLQFVTEGLREALTGAEMRDARSLVMPPEMLPTLSDLMRMQPLNTLVAGIQGEWLWDVLREERLVTFFQPIVASGRPSEVFAYECLLRGRQADGTLIYPDRLFDTARDAGLLFQLDQAARLASIRGAVEHGIECGIFINFNPSSIYDPVFCLRNTINAIHQAGIDPGRVIFEVVESDGAGDPEHLVRILDVYRNAGFKVALDDLGAGYSSLNRLTRLRPDLVKLDIQLIRNVNSDPYKAAIASKILEMAHSLGIRTVAEGVETEGEWKWCREHGADYVQGYYFARPACPPPFLASGAPAPVAEACRMAA